MKIGFGHLRLSADQFWRMSPGEFFAACDGYLESKGVRKPGGGIPDAPTKEEVDALFAEVGTA